MGDIALAFACGYYLQVEDFIILGNYLYTQLIFVYKLALLVF